MDKKKPSVLIQDADALIEKGIKTRETYEAALPLMMSMRQAAISLKAYARNLEEHAEALSDATAAYAVEHVTALDEPLHEESGKKQTGSITLGGEVYTLTITPGPIKRTNGDNITKDFLNRLPAEWIKSKPELDVTGINRLGVSEEVLFKHGLLRVEKRAWTYKELEA